MANMNVTYAELEQVASQLQSGQGELEGILAKLQSLVEQLVSAGFQTDQASGA
ncbi:WXG100 family type VII secretion target, partial [Winkia neuii]